MSSFPPSNIFAFLSGMYLLSCPKNICFILWNMFLSHSEYICFVVWNIFVLRLLCCLEYICLKAFRGFVVPDSDMNPMRFTMMMYFVVDFLQSQQTLMIKRSTNIKPLLMTLWPRCRRLLQYYLIQSFFNQLIFTMIIKAPLYWLVWSVVTQSKPSVTL